MIFKALLPLRKQDTSRVGMLTDRSKYFKKIPDELYDEAVIDIFATNERNVSPLFPSFSKYIFAICDNKPVDSENLKWEPYPIFQEYTPYKIVRIKNKREVLKKIHTNMVKKKYDLMRARKERKKKNAT